MSGAANEGTRRVVTAHDEKGISQLLLDALATNTKRPAPGLSATLLWCTDRTPADIALGLDVEDLGARIIGTQPPPSGSRFTMLELAPGARSTMHRTETVDYITVVAGEIDMVLEDGSQLRLRAGDTMVQRGTNHLWANNGTKAARFSVTMLDADPLGVGQPVGVNETAR